MVFFSTKSRQKIYHQPHCVVRKRINRAYEKWFPSSEASQESEYHMCSYCSLAGMMLRKEKTEVDNFCQEKSIIYRMNDGMLYLSTANSDWVVTEEGSPRRIQLYHKNTLEKLEEAPGSVPGYHPQNARVKTLMEVLWYIVGHDNYREKEIAKAKEKRKNMRNLRNSTWKYQQGKGRARIRANQLYSLLDKDKS